MDKARKAIKRKKSFEEDNDITNNNKDRLDKAKKKLSVLKTKNIEITNQIKLNKEDYKYNNPTKFKYNDKEFIINSRKYYELYECTWKCLYFRRIKDLPLNQKNFCNATIKGIRNALNSDQFNFYLLEDHSQICKNLKFINNNEKILEKKRLYQKNSKIKKKVIKA